MPQLYNIDKYLIKLTSVCYHERHHVDHGYRQTLGQIMTKLHL